MYDLHDLKFSALFHDIGKFYQRANNNDINKLNISDDNLNEYDFRINNSSIWSADFVQDYFNDVIKNIVLYHDDPSNSLNKELCDIIHKAKNYSFPDDVNINEGSNVPLTSIFSRVILENETQDKYYVPLSKLDFNKSIYPRKYELGEKFDLIAEYDNLWKQFVQEFDQLKNIDFETSLALLKKYAFSIPYSTNNDFNDISLYNHLKMTVALSNCLYFDFNDEKSSENEFSIINGDISGIQNFIYKVSSPNESQSGMSKRLRGRSLYISLLTESISDKIINDLDLDSSNVLFCGGGRFIIIAPNTRKTEKVLLDIDEKINEFFIDQFNAELYLALVSTSVSGNELNNFDNILSELSRLLNNNKKHKFFSQLDKLFQIEKSAPYDTCIVCGNPVTEENKICIECKKHERLGQSLANAKYLVKYYGNKIYSEFKLFNSNYIFFEKESDVIKFLNENNDKFTIFTLNDSNFLKISDEIYNNNVSFDFRFIGNTVPKLGHKPLYFNHLAQLSKGSNKLGVLKMDVDNLGKIFSRGFENVGGASISRISSLSFNMDLFFAGLINQIASKFKFFTKTEGHDNLFIPIDLKFIDDEEISVQTVYKAKDVTNVPDECLKHAISTIHINYSGGDDLLVIGPYDDIIEFSYEFRNRFKDWTSQNDSINISGGIIIVNSKFPIGNAAIISDKKLDKSKDCGKNKITVFDDVLNWNSQDSNFEYMGLDNLIIFAKYLESLCEDNVISKNLIYSLLKLYKLTIKNSTSANDEKSWKENNDKKLDSKSFVPKLMYKLRIISQKDIRENMAKNAIRYMPWIKVPVSWVSLRLR